jgi:hypothetical protein
VDLAVASFPDAAQIYEANILTMEKLGNTGYEQLLAA